MLKLVDEEELAAVIDRLEADERISGERARLLRQELPAAVESSAYVIRHLSVHLGLGAFFAFDFIPLPLGTISRVLWVIGNRIYESVRGRGERARVHSFGVLLFAAIPFLGYFAYLLPLRRRSQLAAFICANHISYSRNGTSFDGFIASRSKPVGRFLQWLVPHPY